MEGDKQFEPETNKTLKKEGIFGRKPSLGWKCFVKLKLNGELGSELKSNYLSTDTAEIVIGDGDWLVDKAIESCLETMHEKEESTFHLKLDRNIELELDISLDSCSRKSFIFEWSDSDKMEACKKYKADGVSLFKGDRIEHAFYKFSKALKMLLIMNCDSSEDENTERDEILKSLYNNLANCQFHFKNYSYVLELCKKSLSVNPSVKAYFWRAMAYVELKDYDNAESDLFELLKIEPENKTAIEKFKLVRNLNKKNRDNYERIIKNMFR